MQWGEWRQEHADGGGAWDGPAACGEWEAVQIHPTGGTCPDPGSAKGKDPCHSDTWWVGVFLGGLASSCYRGCLLSCVIVIFFPFFSAWCHIKVWHAALEYYVQKFTDVNL